MSVYLRVSNTNAESLQAINGISLSRIAAINASVSSAFALLLNESYGEGAVAAYSVRRINALYNSGCMVVRRDSDDDFLVIGFDSNDNLDVSAIEVFCGTANGYVSDWLDQSGNKNVASQPSLTAQPKIYDSATGVVMENGKPAIEFNGTSNSFDTSWSAGDTSAFTVFNIASPTNNTTSSQLYDLRDANDDGLQLIMASDSNLFYSADANDLKTTAYVSGQQLVYSNYSGARIFTAIDGATVETGSAPASTSVTANATLFRDGTANAFYFNGNAQEAIFYVSDKSRDRTNIESNIGDYFTQNTPLLDTYTGSSGAYSLRLLRDAYNGPLIRVREDGNDSLLDIYPNVFGELDTAALAAHCGNRNGLVTGWYDQSGNLINAAQPSATAQPKIYDAITGLIVDANGKPAMQFDGTNHYFEALSLNLSQPITASMVAKVDDANINYFFDGDDVTNRVSIFQNSSSAGFTPFAGASLASNVKNTNNNLHFALYNGTSSAYHLNGDSIASGNAGTNIADGIIIGSRYNIDGNKLDGTMQELVFWESNESVNREGIEGNINSYYDIYDTGLVGEYGGAAAAYSLRNLSSLYDGAAITVRRDSDDSTKNIYFDSDGNLDTADLIGFCANNNGYITRWFDQSGNSNNATQPSFTSQPKIYDGVTGVVTRNAKPAIYIDRDSNSSGDKLVTPATTWMDSNLEYACITVFTPGSGNSGDTWVWDSSGGGTNKAPSIKSVSSVGIQMQAIGTTSAIVAVSSAGQAIRSAYLSSGTLEAFYNGSSAGTATAAGTYNASIERYMGSRVGASEGHYDGYFQEMIWYANDQSSNRTGIEANINNNYLIYQPDTAPTSGLLATYSGAAAAYSLRQLSNEAVISVTVRRDSDDATTPIGFKGGVIDTKALTAWCGNSNGYMTTWWDQSTLGNHATQSAFTAQPKIYDSVTGVVTENGKPAIEFIQGSSEVSIGFAGGTYGDIYGVVNIISASQSSVLAITPQGGPQYLSPRLGSTTITALTDYKNGTILNPQTRNEQYNQFFGQGQSLYTGIGTASNPYLTYLNRYKYANMKVQEVIRYTNSTPANQSGIETNIFEFYTQYILDEYSGAAAAYSLRALSSTATNAVQVRRDSDDATQYIGFVRDEFFSPSLDKSALSTFCGSANGYVSEWVDQSGNGNHATQPALTSQPKIYDGVTGVVTQGSAGNEKPSVYFDAAGKNLAMTTQVNNRSYLYVGKPLGRCQAFGGNGNATEAVRTNGTAGYRNVSYEWSNGVLNFNHNGTAYTGITTTPSIALSFDIVLFKTIRTNPTDAATITNSENTQYISELITWDADLQSDFPDISTDVNNYYNVY